MTDSNTTKPLSHLIPPSSFPTQYSPDPRTGAIDVYTLQHLQPPEDSLSMTARRAAEVSMQEDLPDISCSPVQAKLLGLMAYTARAEWMLEVGTLGGVSAIWLASMNPSAKVVTVEFDPHHAKVARQNIADAGLAERVEVIEGAGVDILPRLKEEIEAGKRPKFNFTFIDADKENN